MIKPLFDLAVQFASIFIKISLIMFVAIMLFSVFGMLTASTPKTQAVIYQDAKTDTSPCQP